MKIIYIGAFRFPFFDAAAARVLNVGKAFRELGHDVEYIAMGGQYIEKHRQHDGSYIYQDFTYNITDELDCQGGIFKKMQMKFSRGNKIIALLKKTNLSNSLVIAYNPQPKLLNNLIKLSREKDFKLAVDLTEWYDRNELPFTDWFSYNWCMTHTMHRIPNKILISSFLGNYYHSNNVIVPATCDSSDAKWQLTIDNPKQFEGITLIYAGNPAKKDLVHTVIKAVNNLTKRGVKIRFLILGTTKDDYLKRYANKIGSSIISEDIVFLGKVSQTEVPAYYRLADYMILLRKNDRKSNAGFPTKFAESMMAGVPVITNPTSDIGKFITNGNNGYLLENENQDCLEEFLLNLCSQADKKLLAKQKENALKTGKEVFDFKNYTETLNRFIQNLS